MEGQIIVGIVVGSVTGIVVAIVTQWLSYALQSRRVFHEKLLDYYATLFSYAITDLLRAREMEASFAIGPPEGTELESIRQVVFALEKERHEMHRMLLQVGTKIRVLEKDHAIKKAVAQLCDTQPFIIPGKWHQGNFNERFDKFQNEILQFRRLIDDTIQQIHRKYREFTWLTDSWIHFQETAEATVNRLTRPATR